MMSKIKVKCTLYVDVDYPDGIEDENGYGNPQFTIEENSCPGTGIVGSEIARVMREQEKKSCCWACALNGTNEIISISEEK
jgi:hypothetical protein